MGGCPMDETMKAEINRLWDESKRQNKRIDILEEDIKELKQLAFSVERLAVQMENMNKVITKVSTDIEEVKNRPAAAWNNATKTILTTIISVIAGGAAVALVQAVAAHM